MTKAVTKRYANERARRALMRTRITGAKPTRIWAWTSENPNTRKNESRVTHRGSLGLDSPFEPRIWLEELIEASFAFIDGPPYYPNECIHILVHGVSVACVHRKGQKLALTAAQAEAQYRRG